MKDTFYVISLVTDRQGCCTKPFRMGRRVKLPTTETYMGCAWLEYAPREGEDYHGTLRTSQVQDFQETKTGYRIETLNSVYYLDECE